MGLKEFFGIGLPRTAWREPDENFRWKIETAQNLQREIKAIVPTEKSGLKHFKALIIGSHGHGKSALINTFASVSAGRKTTVCNSATLERNVTTRYRHFQIPGELEQCVFGDISGLPVSEDIEPFLEDIKLILEGRIKSGYTVSSTLMYWIKR
ncbi:uncharacterized protein LOC132717265 [Ruditapes philippinarum]|uniref:uncharacterized protein LOC132717265 n=1 Tax=Ruditapes philippinarum TaxID=129788 RepID=UPI00295B60ED|nr:uncharacterized protein LOC132717265 [Ruditapes philippinarum]